MSLGDGSYERECRFCTLNKSLKLRWKASDQYIEDWASMMEDIKGHVLNWIETQSTEFYEKIYKLFGEKYDES